MADDAKVDEVVEKLPEAQVEDALPPEDEMSMEALYSEAIDNTQADSAKASLLDPPGTYLSMPKMNVTRQTYTDGRKGLIVNGQGILVQLDNQATEDVVARVNADGGVGVFKGRVKFMFSWEYREHKTRKGQPDFQYKNYIAVRDAYTQMFGQKPESIGQIAEYCRDYQIKYRVIQMGVPTAKNPDPTGEPGNLCTAVYAVKG